MKSHVSDFERGQRIVRILTVLAVVFGVTALLFTNENTRENVYLVLAAFACVIGVVVVALRYCRCPHCGKRILSGVLVARVCPKCRHSLITGKKVKR